MSEQNYVCDEDERFGSLLNGIFSFCDYRVIGTAMIPINGLAVVNVDDYEDMTPQDYYLVVLYEYMDTQLEVYRVGSNGEYPLEYNELDEVSLDDTLHPPISSEKVLGFGEFIAKIQELSE